MKHKLFSFFTAILISSSAMAQNGNAITYELNGGVTNDYGWKTKGEVLLDLQTDINADLSKSYTWAKMEDGIVYYNLNGIWTKETAAEGTACTVTGFVQNTTYNTTEMLKTYISVTKADKYGWLKDVIVAARTAADLAATDEDLSENIYRKEVSAFFLNSPSESAWPASSSYQTMGTLEFFQPIWKHGFVNPTEVTAVFTLSAPYKAGYTFDGWYASADFSGEKVTSIDANTSGTLYAKWVEYIPTLAEVIAMADNTDTKAKGVVTYVNGTNAYIQDASAGMLLYLKNNPSADFVVGKEVVVTGTRTTYGGAPEIKNVEEVRAENGTMPKAVSLATLAAATADPLRYFGKLVAFHGLHIVSYDSMNNPRLSDGFDTIPCYNMPLEQTDFPVGSRVNITAIAGYYNGFRFVGDPAGIMHVSAAGHDNYQYPTLGENGEYTFANKWVYSNVQDNFSDNKPAPNDYARGMVAKDGKMYFINRHIGGFTVVDGATGKILAPIVITGEHLFQTFDDTDSTWKDCAAVKFNDVKLDQAGHFLIGGCVSGGNRFQIYKVDIATGAATVVVDDRLYDYQDFGLEGKATAWRFDAFNVYGNVDSHAIIMAVDGNSFYVYKWEITNGVAGAAEQIDCEPLETDESLLVKDGYLTSTAFGTAPQIFPVDFNYFYVDGWNTLPMLYDMDGMLVEDFATVPTGVQVAMQGDTCNMNTGHNGVVEFQVRNEYFLLMAATNTVGSPTSAFALYKFADENKRFSEMTPMWFFPRDGMGNANNGCRTAIPSVEVNDSVANIYIYANNNGYAAYDLKSSRCKVTFVDWNGDVLKTVYSAKGAGVVAPENPSRYGYTFTGWDKEFDNILSDLTITALYEINKYEITVSCDSVQGNVTNINGEYDYLTELTISAEANYGYHFTRWSDGNTNSPRTITITSDTVLTAMFEPNQYRIFASCDQTQGNITGAGTFSYLTNCSLEAVPHFGYHFVKWLDGNRDNPRSFVLTQDTAFSAIFEINRSGTCGDNMALTWEYDAYAKVLTIKGDGTLNGNYTFGLEAPVAMEKLVIAEGVTTIGNSAFAGYTTLEHISLASSVRTIYEQAFYNCTGLQEIYSYRERPSVAYSNSFDGIDKFDCTLHVLSASVDMYKAATGWRDFYYIQTIDAEAVTEPIEDVSVTPSVTTADIAWPVVDNAATYDLTIKDRNGNVICTLIFNAQGQLTSIAFAAPSRAQQSTQSVGFSFTVTGLDSGSQYGFTIDAKDADGEVIDTKSGIFATTSDVTTDIDNLNVTVAPVKVIRNCQLFILHDGNTYTATGVKVE